MPSYIAKTHEDWAEFLIGEGITDSVNFWSPNPKPVSDPFYDMAWSDESNIWLAEIKSLTEENETHQIRLRLAQLLEYKHKLNLLHKKWISPWLVVEDEPKNPMWFDLLESLQVKLTWPGE